MSGWWVATALALAWAMSLAVTFAALRELARTKRRCNELARENVTLRTWRARLIQGRPDHA